MIEPIDVYSDQFTITIGPYGASLTFAIGPPHPAPGSSKIPVEVATVRMSVEHLKVMLVMIAKQIKRAESDLDTTFEVSKMVLNQLGIGPEDWDKYFGN